MVRYLLRIGYLGTKYRGTQRQPGAVGEATVQGSIEKALFLLGYGNSPKTNFASRTDKGVHALMNVLHVDLEHKNPDQALHPHVIKSRLNTYLVENEHEILVTSACVVPDTFHARKNAKWRSYFYRLAILKPEVHNASISSSCLEHLPTFEINRCHIVSSELNTSVVKNVVDLYVGEHNFTTFTKYLKRDHWKSPRRVIEDCRFYELPNYCAIDDPKYSNISMWEFYLKSRSFLYHQVRKLVGAALAAGLGVMPESYVKSMLESPDANKWSRCKMPPPGGLYLAHIEYDRKDFMMNDTSDFEEKDSVSLKT